MIFFLYTILIEVETTLVPGDDCEIDEGSDPSSIDRSQTKICTKYIPHKPAVYKVVRTEIARLGSYTYDVMRY